jgi:hypothetical protein
MTKNDKAEFFGWGDKNPTNKYTQPRPNTSPMPEGAGYPQTGVKTTGIKIYGTGAATKGTMARGPMG